MPKTIAHRTRRISLARYLAMLLCIAVAIFSPLSRSVALSAPTARELEKAKAHFQSGTSYYGEGLYDDAAREFRRSYEISKRADILYNIAQCYGKLGDDAATVQYLKQYLAEKPKATDRAAVEAWIKNLESRLAAASKPISGKDPEVVTEKPIPTGVVTPTGSDPGGETKPGGATSGAEPSGTKIANSEKSPSGSAAGVKSPPDGSSSDPAGATDSSTGEDPSVLVPPAEVTHTVRRDRGKTLRLAGYISAGVGVALVGYGLYQAKVSQDKASNIEEWFKSYDTWACQGGVCISDQESQGRSAASRAKLFIGIGSVAAIGGGVLWFLGHRRSSEEVTITEKSQYITGAAIWPGGGMATVGRRF